MFVPRKSETAQQFRILCFALQPWVVKQMSWVDFMYLGTLVELRRSRKMKNVWKSIGQGLFRHNSEMAERFRIQFFALQDGVVTPLF